MKREGIPRLVAEMSRAERAYVAGRIAAVMRVLPFDQKSQEGADYLLAMSGGGEPSAEADLMAKWAEVALHNWSGSSVRFVIKICESLCPEAARLISAPNTW